MSKHKIPPPQVYITPGDTQWAVVAKVPPAVLDAARCRLSEMIRTDGSRVVTGEHGVSALLVFGGDPSEGKDLAIRISRKHRTPAYLLDFDDNLEYEDYACAIRKFESAKLTWLKGNPIEFLESHGITAPGFEPLPESPVTAMGVVDDITLDEARKVMPEAEDLFTANARGVLVKDISGTITIRLASAVNRPSFTAFYDREDGTFLCAISRPDRMEDVCFAIGTTSAAGMPLVDSVLGETTLDGVLRVLDIPRDALFGDIALHL
jgi:hypothetical protein